MGYHVYKELKRGPDCQHVVDASCWCNPVLLYDIFGILIWLHNEDSPYEPGEPENSIETSVRDAIRDAQKELLGKKQLNIV